MGCVDVEWGKVRQEGHVGQVKSLRSRRRLVSGSSLIEGTTCPPRGGAGWGRVGEGGAG